MFKFVLTVLFPYTVTVLILCIINKKRCFNSEPIEILTLYSPNKAHKICVSHAINV